MTKIDIISGFLGAGKTTLIKKLISECLKNEKLMIIENEFGQIGIDGGFLKDTGIQITEMNSGCICCSLVGDFGTALEDAIKQYSPDRIIIEPSGVGKLSDVIKAVERVENDVEISLNSYTAVVDAQKCKMYMKNFGEFFNNQIESAKTIILSRSQKLSEEKLQAVVDLIREHNDKAALITTPWEDISGEKILEAMEKKNTLEDEIMAHIHEDDDEDHCCDHDHDHEHHHEHHHEHDHNDHDDDHECCCHHDHDEEEHEHHHDEECGCGEHHHHHHHADDVFTSWGKETPKKYDKDELKAILDKLSGSEEFGFILRAKGIIQTTDGKWVNFDLVPEEYEIREGEPDYTGRLCVIGKDLKTEEIEKLFKL